MVSYPIHERITNPESVVVITPADAWYGVAVAHRRGFGAFIAARGMFYCCERWPKIECYNPKSFAHRGLQLEAPFSLSAEQLRGFARECRDEASTCPPKVREWLVSFAVRMEAEADFDMKRMARLMR